MSELPSMQRLRALTSPAGARPFRVGIVIGPGFIPMDMVGVQAVFGLMPGAEIHLLWKTLDLVEGFPSGWTRPTTTFAACPRELDVVAVGMLPPEIESDPEVVGFIGAYGSRAKYVIGVCNGVLLLGAAGLLQGKRVTSNHNALPILAELGVAEVVSGGPGVVVDGNCYTAGPGVGSFEAALQVAEAAFGRPAAEFAELLIEYDPHPPFGVGAVKNARPEQVAQFEAALAHMAAQYRSGTVAAYQARPKQADPLTTTGFPGSR
jgi:putative intracellular protease/amidase